MHDAGRSAARDLKDVVGGGGGTSLPGGHGGAAHGILVADSARATLSGNTVHDIVGGQCGRGGQSCQGLSTAGAGDASGILFQGGIPLGSLRDRVFTVRGGTAAGIRVEAVRNLTVTHALLRDVVASNCAGLPAVGAGVAVGSGASLASLSHTLVSTVSQACAWNHPANAPAALPVSYTDFWDCGGARSVNATEGAGMIAGDPRLDGDDTLTPGSPAIDAGDPALDCGDEPRSADGTCIVDLGHLGGTHRARAR